MTIFLVYLNHTVRLLMSTWICKARLRFSSPRRHSPPHSHAIPKFFYFTFSSLRIYRHFYDLSVFYHLRDGVCVSSKFSFGKLVIREMPTPFVCLSDSLSSILRRRWKSKSSGDEENATRRIPFRFVSFSIYIVLHLCRDETASKVQGGGGEIVACRLPWIQTSLDATNLSDQRRVNRCGKYHDLGAGANAEDANR